MRSRILSVLALPFAAACTAAETSQPDWQLAEEVRIGGEDAEATMFTDIRGLAAGPDGRIFVLDARPQEIRMFDRDGTFMSTVARKGQGPGEIAGANGMLLVGDTLWVNDPPNGRWSAWSAIDGTYLRQITIAITSYGYIWEAGLDADSRIVDPISVPGSTLGANGRPVSERRLRRVSTDGEILDTVAIPDCAQRSPPARTSFIGTNTGPRAGQRFMAIPFLAQPVGALDGEGGYWCSPNEDYLLVHRALGSGDTLHTVSRPYTRIPVSDSARDAAVDNAKTSLASYQDIDADYSLIPREHPVFVRLQADDAGRLWARRTTAPGEPLGFDVYDASARRVASVTSGVPFATYPPLAIQGEHVYGVVRDADDIPYVVRARIVRDGQSGRP